MRGRSANRGECAQICRLPYDLYDGADKCVERGRHLLSLRDLNLSDRLEAMLDAGGSSLKIEGRLKDVGYGTTVTSLPRTSVTSSARRSEPTTPSLIDTPMVRVADGRARMSSKALSLLRYNTVPGG